MTTTDKLLPCPFCGSSVRLGCDDYSIKASQKYYIECQGIDCLMQDMEDLDCDLLVAAWNRRASQAAPDLSDGTCAECGCAPVNADSLCATCVDERHAPAPSDGLREALEDALDLLKSFGLNDSVAYRNGIAALTPEPAQEDSKHDG